MIIQYGKKFGFQQGTEINLPISFTAHYTVITGREHTAIGAVYYHSIITSSLSVFTYQNGGSGGDQCYLHWIAIGY